MNYRGIAAGNGTVTGVYSEDGTSINFTRNGNIISVGFAFNKNYDRKPKYAKVSGISENRIGYIVTDLIAKSPTQLYNSTNWDMTETDAYRNASPRINIAFTSGNIKTNVATVLKNDMAFLIQKAAGVFSIRKWGGNYPTRTMADWQLTQQPTKEYADAQKNYFSRCAVKYKYNERTKEYASVYLYTELEAETIGKFVREVEGTFETRHLSEANARALAVAAGGRFCDMRATFKIGVGADTSQFDLLDKVNMKIAVNGRIYSDKTAWVIKEIDPAQEKLTLEEL
jgi:hypothetical protein